jgi:Tfp pilus assembly protein FimT
VPLSRAVGAYRESRTVSASIVLLELLAVVAIIAILAALLLPGLRPA